MIARAAALLPALLLAACAGQPVAEPPQQAWTGHVDKRFIVPAGAERHVLADDELFLMPELHDGAALPAYPAEALRERQAAVVVCLVLHVDETGAVFRSLPLYGEPGCMPRPDPAFDAFVAAGHAAVAGWRFTPAARCRVDAGSRCAPEDPGWERLPVRLGYAFEFEQDAAAAQVQALR